MLTNTPALIPTDSESAFEQIASNEIALMRLLHPFTDGFIAFAVGDEDGLFPRIAFRSDALPTTEIPVPPRDSYVSINQAFCTKRRGRRPKSAAGSVIGVPCHRTDTLRYLCAAYADLDHHDLGLTGQEMMSGLAELQQERVIPLPSLLVRSGRGTWVVWLLRDALDPEKPVRVYKEGSELAAHKAIQTALYQRLAKLGSDPQVCSPVRYLRIPGSLNTKSEEIVRWVPQNDETGCIPRYTLAQMQEHLGIQQTSGSSWPQRPRLDAPKQSRPSRLDANGKPRRGRAGWEGLRARRLRDFQKLWQIRKSFKKGTRNNAIFYYGVLLMLTGKPFEDVYHDLSELNKSCQPPLSDRTVLYTLRSVVSRKYRKISDQTVADSLDITPQEASQLECKVVASRFRTVTFPSAPKRRRVETDAERISARHAAIRDIVDDRNGEIPSARKMVKFLAEKGITAGHVTITKDYKLLQLNCAGNQTTLAA